MTQLNTPYPATAYLTGFLRQHAASHGLDVRQADPALELFLRLFSRDGLTRVAARLRDRDGAATPAIVHFLQHADTYVDTVDAVIRFLQGRDPTMAVRIAGRELLPEGPRFAPLGELAGDPDDPDADPDGLGWAFGALGLADRARYLASLYVDDLADVVRDGVDPRFELSRYGERLAASAPTFDPLAAALAAPPTLVDDLLDDVARELLAAHRPDLLGLSAPFPGNIYGAFRIAAVARRDLPDARIALGGGFVNTELRQLSDPRVFDHVDYVTLDDGERPLLALIEHLRDPARPLLRTFVRDDGRVVFRTDPTLHDLPQRDCGTPTYDGLPLDRYVSLFEMLNPMHRLWSDGRWNKLTVAHGCYWKKCSFCDVTLDYIGRYDAASADQLVDRVEALIAETGTTGFHLVDEAAPPAGLRAFAERLLARKVVITWWGNIRFEKTFTPELAALLARAGCVAISGGLEVASDRLLTLMNKGVTVAQVARVTRAFTDAGVMVHAYLMYGFPTETEQDTVDALERVRQLFAAGCIQSAFWHRFAATAHSPIGHDPERYGIRLHAEPPVTFARNDLAFTDPTPCDHDFLGDGLRRALYNYMHGLGLDADVRTWFAPRGKRKLPAPKVARDLIEAALRAAPPPRGSRAGSSEHR
ncbi:MAG: B12-binding domain-containing radical SAM protein [Kofleriaceae bacterium]|nr:B12-binding domain-containing radical SAM protein [Kofleriaceae bacterium]MCB9573166.1 B12-binding domain-containing radical SAM protein [Kofleriaceae bacterium]